MRKRPLAVLLLGAVTVTGCAAQTPSTPAPAIAVRSLRVGLSEWSVQTSARRVTPGAVTMVVTNAGSDEHNLVVRQGGRTLGLTQTLPPGQRQTLHLTVSPRGSLRLFCSLPGHDQAGMHALLAVGPAIRPSALRHPPASASSRAAAGAPPGRSTRAQPQRGPVGADATGVPAIDR